MDAQSEEEIAYDSDDSSISKGDCSSGQFLTSQFFERRNPKISLIAFFSFIFRHNHANVMLSLQ